MYMYWYNIICLCFEWDGYYFKNGGKFYFEGLGDNYILMIMINFLFF